MGEQRFILLCLKTSVSYSSFPPPVWLSLIKQGKRRLPLRVGFFCIGVCGLDLISASLGG